MADDVTTEVIETPVLELTEREKEIAAGGDPDAVTQESATDGAGVEAEGTDAPTEIPDGGEAEAGDGSEDQPEGGTDAAPEPETWIDDDAKTLAKSYGLTEDELSTFGSAAEFDRATALFDRKLVAGVRAAPVAEPAAESAPVIPPVTQDAAPSLKKLDEQAYVKAGYDNDTLELVRNHNAMVEQNERLAKMVGELDQFRQQQVQQDELVQHRRRLDHFHDVVDQLDAGRYGRSVDDNGRPLPLNKLTNENRKTLWENANLLRDGLALQARRSGQPVEELSMSVLLKRAERLAFGNDLIAEERRKFQEQVSAQSKRRRPAAGRSRPMAPVKPAEGGGVADPAAEIASNPEIIKMWDRFQDESGTR